MKWIFLKENIPVSILDRLLIYVVVGAIVGARLGHCLFYEPDVYLKDPIRILKIWEGGLASHGGAIGILIFLYFFMRRENHFSFLWLLDRISIPVALAGASIRIGNFFNSEIVGRPTSVPWAVTFLKFDQVPRHPTQLYEAFIYLLVFVTLLFIYRSQERKNQPGYLFGIFLVGVFGSRFLIEFLKEPQVPFERSLPIDLGQLLSLPAVCIGLFLWFRSKKLNSEGPISGKNLND